jgi:hypothetical protein
MRGIRLLRPPSTPAVWKRLGSGCWTDKTIIDAETVEIVTKILDYEYAVRVLTDPIDADTSIAKMEESIRRQLSKRGKMTDRELRQYTNAKRVGLWAYDAAIKNLRNHADTSYNQRTGLYASGASTPSTAPIGQPEAAETTATRDPDAAAKYAAYREDLRTRGLQPADLPFTDWAAQSCSQNCSQGQKPG